MLSFLEKPVSVLLYLFTYNGLFQIIIDNLNPRWVSSLMIGILCSPVTRNLLPVTAFGFKKDAWIIAGDSVYHNGHKVVSNALYIGLRQFNRPNT